MPELVPKEITGKCVAIVKFGPAGFDTDGMRPAEYYQVTIDPKWVSKSGDYIRFGMSTGDEIQGWQRIKALTVIEILAEYGSEVAPEITTGHDSITMTHLEA